nr:MAG TPA: hypothetical protein [Caudoviricetes sp.]
MLKCWIHAPKTTASEDCCVVVGFCLGISGFGLFIILCHSLKYLHFI